MDDPDPSAVPPNWRIRRLGQIGAFRKGSGGSREDDVDSGVPCVRYGDLYRFHHTFITRPHSFLSKERSAAYTPIEVGELLLALSGESLDEIGKSAVNLVPGAVCGGDTAIFAPNREINPQFLAYAVDSAPCITQKAQAGRGDIVVHVSPTALKRLQVTVPPAGEQAAIVKYLAHANARIDRAIAAKRKLITLLEEQKQAVINQAVTRVTSHTFR